MGSNRLAEDILDLADEQGFSHKPLMGGNGWIIYPKDTEKSPVTIYRSASNGRTDENIKALCRRIGIKFPSDIERERRLTKTEKIPMVVAQPKSMLASDLKPDSMPVGVDEIIERIIKRNNAQLEAMVQTEEDLKMLRSKLKDQEKSKADAMRELLRQAGLFS